MIVVLLLSIFLFVFLFSQATDKRRCAFFVTSFLHQTNFISNSNSSQSLNWLALPSYFLAEFKGKYIDVSMKLVQFLLWFCWINKLDDFKFYQLFFLLLLLYHCKDQSACSTDVKLWIYCKKLWNIYYYYNTVLYAGHSKWLWN